MNTPGEIKEIVKEKYGSIAKAKDASSCCGSKESLETIMSDSYAHVDGYHPDADLGLGCGVPTAFAHITEGMTVLDLGSGAGNDVFIASKYVGAAGKVIGVDMTREMIDRADTNKTKLNVSNVEFRLGEIESLPIEDNIVDVVISNCVLNLVPDKRKAFGEIYRVLKSGGHFTVSDIVLEGEIPASLQNIAEVWAGCVAGAMQKDDYLHVAEQAGFVDLVVEKEKEIAIPKEMVRTALKAMSLPETLSDVKIKSITVRAIKPYQQTKEIFRRALITDLGSVRSLLSQNDLPDIELEKYIRDFIVLEREGEIIGCGGLEIHDQYGLIRSVAIHSSFHSQGFGSKLYQALEIDARMFFLKALYLFTYEAEPFFRKHGYQKITRDKVPTALHSSGEYKYDCCEHAFVMMKKISDEQMNEQKIELPVMQIKSCCG